MLTVDLKLDDGIMFRRSLLAAVFVLITVISGHVAFAQSDKKIVYAVLWRGCEELCQGFQEYFAENSINAKIVIRDVGRDKTKLRPFLQEARAMKANLILTWGTSATLGIAGRLDDANNPQFNNDIPHVFAAVADPVGAGIVKSLESTGRANVTGTFNRVPEAVNINTIRSYLPAFKRLGLLYNTNEKNSVLKMKEIEGLAGQMNFELIARELQLGADGKPKVEDISIQVAELKANGADFIYLGSSSFLDDNRDEFTQAAVDSGIPVLSPYERLVRDSDALLSIAARYNGLGRLAAKQAEKILVGGQVPGDIPVARMTEFAYVINMEVARKLNLYPPVEILQFAETVK